MTSVSRPRLRAVMAVLFAGLWLGGCIDRPTEPLTTGALRVTVVTLGAPADHDPDGYIFRIDSGPWRPLPADAWTEPRLGLGEHSVALGGAAPNCAVGGANPRAAPVQADQTVEVSFAVACQALALQWPGVVSDPVPGSGASAMSSGSSSSATGDAEVVYVSLPPGTIRNGERVSIRNRTTGDTVAAVMLAGGLDPVEVQAAAGDLLDIQVRVTGGFAPLQFTHVVAAKRAPIVVRTNPPPKKRDVPLNVVMIVVFSEPIDPATLSATTMYLLEGQSFIAGRLEFTDEAQLTAALVPDAPLTSGTDYQLVVTTGIEDLDGDSLEAPVFVEFTSAPPVASVHVSPDAATIVIGDTVRLTAAARDSGGNNLLDRSVDWASSNRAVASVSPTGLVTAGAVGLVHIVASVEGKADSAMITVTDVPVASVTVNPTAASVSVGDTVQVTALVRDGAGNVLLNRPVTWATSDPATATVSLSGLVRGVAAGSAVIVASVEGKADSTMITVTDVPVASVTVTPAADSVWVGDSVQLTALVRDGAGNVLPNRPVTWATGDSAIATVSPTGLVRGVRVGSASIVASVEGKADTATIEVATPVAPASLEIATISSGPNQPESYTVCIDLDCTQSFTVQPNSALSFPVSPGTYRVWIGAGGAPCGVGGENPRTVDVPAGATTQVLFEFTCTEFASLLAVGVGAGASVCLDFYDPDLGVCSPRSWQAQGPDLLIEGLLAGRHTVWTFGAPIESGRAFDVSPGQTVIVRFDSSGGTAFRMAFSAQPTITGHDLKPAIIVSAKSSAGWTVADFTGGVTLTIGDNPGGGSLLGTTTVAAVAGIATFTDLQLDRDGTAYTLVATADGLSSGTSAPFQVVSNASIVVAPTSVAGVVGGNVPITATVRDANGLEVRDAPVTWVASDSALVRVESYWYQGRAARAWASASMTVVLTATSLNQSATATVSFDYVRFDSLGEGCGLTTGGAAYCWSGNLPARGIGPVRSIAVGLEYPLRVAGDLKFGSLAVGTYHRCGVTPGGETYCWGQNDQGQLGDGSTETRWAAVPVAGGHLFASVTTGLGHTCGLTSSGEGYCWGANRWGQLGDGSTVDHPTPVPITGGLTFTALSAGGEHTCGLTTGGTAYCWGRNGNGQLGNGTTTDSPLPMAVSGGLTLAGIAAGNEHTCGLTTSGTVYCWGAAGQLGNGSMEGAASPVAVAGGLTFTQLGAGARATCGLTIDQEAYCWGLWMQLIGNVPEYRYTLTPTTVWPWYRFVKLGATCGVATTGVARCLENAILGEQ